MQLASAGPEGAAFFQGAGLGWLPMHVRARVETRGWVQHQKSGGLLRHMVDTTACLDAVLPHSMLCCLNR